MSTCISLSFLVSCSALASVSHNEDTHMIGQRTALVRKEASELQAPAWPSEETIKDKLEHLEEHFGGLVHNVARHAVGSEDPRSPEQWKTGGMIGGDRFCGVEKRKGCHGYGPVYAKYLQHLLAKPVGKQSAVAEVGILKGSGLAIWSELFPEAAVHGFDIDLKNTRDNMGFLKAKGAFATGEAHLHVYDQFKDNAAAIKKIIGRQELVLVAEDGFHSDETSAKTFDSFYPSLSGDWVYIVEDAHAYTGAFEKHMLETYVNQNKAKMHREETGPGSLLYIFTPNHAVATS